MQATEHVLSPRQVKKFQAEVWQYFLDHKRDLPWRNVGDDGTINPYHILVSEVMLQQTQVARVIPKYQSFLAKFPDLQTLAQATLADVLIAWSGLGYNRRARYLHIAAQELAKLQPPSIPKDIHELIKLPGVGQNTAAAVLVYAFNIPHVFVETNIRSVFLHHFFDGQSNVADRQLMPYIEETLPANKARKWYWALMDYGSYLKSVNPNPSRASKHHVKQTKFEGSKRQLRGAVLKQLMNSPATLAHLETNIPDERLQVVLEDLASEGLITQNKRTYHLGK